VAQVTVADDSDNDRYTAEVGGELVGFAAYHMRGGKHVFFHTEIDPSHSGMGVATSLIRQALDDVRDKGGTVVPLCPFVAGFMERHPEYLDLVDDEMWAWIRSRVHSAGAS
jgi:predicted GNAT family acetyltransferase